MGGPEAKPGSQPPPSFGPRMVVGSRLQGPPWHLHLSSLYLLQNKLSAARSCAIVLLCSVPGKKRGRAAPFDLGSNAVLRRRNTGSREGWRTGNLLGLVELEK